MECSTTLVADRVMTADFLAMDADVQYNSTELSFVL